MNTNWNLDVIYPGYDSPEFTADFARLDEVIAQAEAALAAAQSQPAAQGLETVLRAMEALDTLANRLFEYVGLRGTVDTADAQTAALQGQLQRKLAAATAFDVGSRRYIASVPDLEAVLEGSDFLKEYRFLCLEIQQQAEHLLSPEVEETINRMNITGGSAWENLFSYLTSTVTATVDGKELGLAEVRNLAHDEDPALRKRAYEAELACYEKIQDPIAYALNSIKGEVIATTRQRGYATPLAATLEQSRMRPETLEAMLTAMRESLPAFHRYLRAKAKLLGYEGGLPWYELFAPVGQLNAAFTPESARDYLVEIFGQLAPDLAAMMAEAFDNQWIDFYPKKGKVGGAFCSTLPDTADSRILTNFSGDFGSVDTLAHELGHAYHNRQVSTQRPLNRNYTMPIAETASTFNETHLTICAAARAKTPAEKLALLETLLSNTTQTICDIYSRYLFESAVFQRCEQEFLQAEQLKQIMLDAQRTAYGDGLAPDALHPYMWACKSHYYSTGVSFYNFPYAFGCLLAMGLYRQFQQQGEAFLPGYRALLHATPVMTLEEVAAQAGIDITTPDFWRESLAAFGEQIDVYVGLCEELAQ